MLRPTTIIALTTVIVLASASCGTAAPPGTAAPSGSAASSGSAAPSGTTGASATTPLERPLPPLDLVPCEAAPGIAPARCGTMSVPLDRNRTDGPTIDLRVVVLPATGDAPAEDPIFFLQGGPGGNAGSLIPLAGAMEEMHRRRDLVFLDQRGTGGSHPLDCGPSNTNGTMEILYGFSFSDETLAECVAALQGADPASFTTPVAVQDLEDVRRALGYGQINLWAGSYGTRVALEFARRFPASARTLFLRGVAGTDYRLPLVFAAGAQEALDSVEARCLRAEACRPGTDLDASVTRIAGRLAADPVVLAVPPADGGGTEEVTLSEDVFLGGIRFLLYDPSWSSQIPGIVAAADTGNFAPFLGLAVPLARALRAQFSFGMTLAVVCAEDEPRLREQEIARASANTFLGDRIIRRVQAACDAWPGEPVALAYHDPVTSDVPTLAVSGVVDPVTPPRTAEEALRAMRNVVHLVFPEYSHSPPFTPCLRQAWEAMMDRGATEGLEGSCGG